MKKSIKISIIIVNYEIHEELFDCIHSLVTSKSKIFYEIIVVDNDKNKTIHADLHNEFPEVIYIPNENNGYGQANNVGAKKARGEYLFFLNPDTTLEQGWIDSLVTYLNKHNDVGIVAPLLLGVGGEPYQQGTTTLRPLEGIVCLSFLNKLFPNNPISKKYFIQEWDKKTEKEVAVVPGTAMMIKRELFEKVGGFDPKFFLFFEEFDLCNRVKKLRYKLVILPQVKIKHIWGASVNQKKDVQSIFEKSKFYYFKKYYGLFWACAVQLVTNISKTSIALFLVLLVSLFLNTYRLPELMTFIGDQGWFYLSARDMVLTGEIPLVGIASSHPWLHQGALWTYMLGIVLWIFHFDPVSGAYFTAILGTISVSVLYFIAARMFSKRVGIVAALLYATSPLIIANARFAYHTSPIPFFVILFLWSFYKWVKGNVIYFPIVILFLGILYSLELATTLLAFPILLFLCYGVWKKTQWVRQILTKKIIGLSFFAFFVSLIPILIYDLSHGFKQTAGFAVWMVYTVVKPLLHSSMLTQQSPVQHANLSQFLYETVQRLFFLPNGIVALCFFLFSLGFFVWIVLQMNKRKMYDVSCNVLFVVFLIPFVGFLIAKTPSDAYLPLFFPLIILITSISLNRMFRSNFFLAFFLSAIVCGNIFFFLGNNYSFSKKGDITMAKRIEAVKNIQQIVDGDAYNLIGKEQLSIFPSSVMNYTYLLWHFCNTPSVEDTAVKIFIKENIDSIVIEKLTVLE